MKKIAVWLLALALSCGAYALHIAAAPQAQNYPGVSQTSNAPQIFNSSLKFADAGTCTMNGTSGCSAQTLSRTYTTAPLCWTEYVSGTLTGLQSAPSTTTTVTPASSVTTDTAVVHWFCEGN